MTPNTSDPKSSKQAIALGLRQYFTGKPCKNGHTARRYVTNRQCEVCLREQVDARRTEDPERARQLARKRYAATVETERARNLAYYHENREARNEYARTWSDANRDRKRFLCARWRRANPARVCELASTRHAAKLKRLPAWADRAAIQAFYEARPPDMTVDHIIPLQGKLVSGLHVPNNLQYLTQSENSAKHNKFNPADYYTTKDTTP